jgi:prepilin-type N-terminal cleavage/methylation domain-containing protein
MKKAIIDKRESAGYTLVELLVASAIVACTVLVLAGVIRQGNEISIIGQHRLRARAIIDSCFESPAYHFKNYDAVPVVNGAAAVIDNTVGKSGTAALLGTLTVTVAVDTNRTATTGTTLADKVEFKRVTMTVAWLDGSGNESVVLEKLLTRL